MEAGASHLPGKENGMRVDGWKGVCGCIASVSALQTSLKSGALLAAELKAGSCFHPLLNPDPSPVKALRARHFKAPSIPTASLIAVIQTSFKTAVRRLLSLVQYGTAQDRAGPLACLMVTMPIITSLVEGCKNDAMESLPSASRPKCARTIHTAPDSETRIKVLGHFADIPRIVEQDPHTHASPLACPTACPLDCLLTRPPARPLGRLTARPLTCPPVCLPAATRALLLALKECTAAAERARDDSIARLAAVSTSWAQDAPAGFPRVVAEGGGRLVLDVPIPSAGSAPFGYESRNRDRDRERGYAAHSERDRFGYERDRDRERYRDRGRRSRDGFSTLQFPPVPPAHLNAKRPRTDGMDSMGYAQGAYPNKTARGERTSTVVSYPAPTHEAPHAPAASSSRHPVSAANAHGHPHAHGHHLHGQPRQPPRDRDRSPSAASDDLETLLNSTNPSPRAHHPASHHAAVACGASTSTFQAQAQAQAQAPPGRSPEWVRAPAPDRGATLEGPRRPSAWGASASPRHVCVPAAPAGAAPVVVGQATAVAGSPIPATNATNQSICRQCGLPGCYKEGKCVEKWVPLGPGAVCDRCRKMKRVERRGTLEQAHAQQAAAAAAATATPGAGGTAAFRARMHRMDTLPALYHEREPPQESSMHSSLAGASASGTGRVIKNRPMPSANVSTLFSVPASVQTRLQARGSLYHTLALTCCNFVPGWFKVGGGLQRLERLVGRVQQVDKPRTFFVMRTRTQRPLRVWEERDPKRPERWGKKYASEDEGRREESFEDESVGVQTGPGKLPISGFEGQISKIWSEIADLRADSVLLAFLYLYCPAS
ncbi:hypothetical protein GGX14DRAFT_674778 [Mycena pura]|uniref:Uncharacterized protein n=1 Tax=Mycena pura TaxID=153505 RepID=A0AAD6Y843_9AGAR|nr:hypothetical protein GGX14DRAFT_674778 [Mycena pura]